jgi:hypothetical protein
LSKDITPILAGWEYDPDELQVRIVTGNDGDEKIQMRLDLGLIQMEMSGRPDGTSPEGRESLLEVYEERARIAAGDREEFSLDSAACAALMHEGVQYYHRYRAAFHLQRYDLVARDTARNLRLFAFVVQHATRQRDKVQFDQFRPFVTMVHTRAIAHQALARADYGSALELIDQGVAKIRDFLREYGQADNEAECSELGFLLRWRREVEAERPVGPLERLEQQLQLAISVEEYEEAARIRDQIQRLRGSEAAAHPGPATAS